MKIFIGDSFNNFTQNIDKDTGFLHIKGVIARTGIQQYYGMELNDSEADGMTLYNVYRPKEEVLNPESLKGFINATVTDEHPSEFVTVDNYKDLSKGSSASYEIVNEDGIDYIKSELVITDKSLIKKIIDGKMEISAGYTQNLIKESGEFNGVHYQYKQTDIKINHIAIVDSARCGNKCKIMHDSNNAIIKSSKILKGENMKIKINDAEFEVCDAVANHLNDLETKLSNKEDEAEKLKAEKDMLEEEAKKKATDSNMIDSVVNAKVELLTFAKSVDVVVDSALSVTDMKKAIVSSKTELQLDGKADAYIDASFDMLKLQIDNDAKRQQEIKDSQKKAIDGHKDQTNDASMFANLKDKEL
jgi:hypothetical protein